MDNEIIDLTNKLEKNQPADPKIFQTIINALDCNFPPDYLAFMLAHNGAEGSMEESWLRLWPIEELEKANKGYNNDPEDLPEVLLIGSDGGGEAFGIRKATGVFIQVPFIDMDEENLSEIGNNFKEFLTALNTDFLTRIQGYLSVTGILKKLNNYFISQKSIAAAHLQEGLLRHEIEQKLTGLNVTLPWEVFELFEWRNGMDDFNAAKLGDKWFFPLGTFYPLEDCIRSYNHAQEKGFYPPKFFPIAGSLGGDDLVVNCDRDDPKFGYIYMQSFVLCLDKGSIAYYQSLHSMLKCILECFESGAYHFENGSLEVDDEKADPIIDKYMIEEDKDDNNNM